MSRRVSARIREKKADAACATRRLLRTLAVPPRLSSATRGIVPLVKFEARSRAKPPPRCFLPPVPRLCARGRAGSKERRKEAGGSRGGFVEADSICGEYAASIEGAA